MARGLAADGHVPTVFLLRDEGALGAELRHDGIPVVALGERSPPTKPIRLVRAVRAFGPDVVYSMLPVANVAAVLLRRAFGSAPVVMGVRAIAPERELTAAVRVLYRLEARLARRSARVVTNSKAAAAWMHDRSVDPAHIDVIPNGIDTGRFRFDRAARHELRSDWGIGPESVLAGRVGGLRPAKDYPTFLRAAAHLASRHPPLRFVCVGGGPPERRVELRRLASSLDLDDRVIWADERSDIPRVMSALDVLVSSSATESFPNVIGEAMACGVPCAVTDVGDSAWIVGDTGEVAPPGDAVALAAAVERLTQRLETDGRALRTTTRARIETEFGVGSMVRATESILSQVVAGRP